MAIYKYIQKRGGDITGSIMPKKSIIEYILNHLLLAAAHKYNETIIIYNQHH
jgi:hypothetical protein